MKLFVSQYGVLGLMEKYATIRVLLQFNSEATKFLFSENMVLILGQNDTVRFSGLVAIWLLDEL